MVQTSRRFWLGSFLCAGLLFIANPVWAQGSTPALSGVSEIQIQPGRMGNKPASDSCGLSSGEVAAQIQDFLKTHNLPVYSIMDTPEQIQGRARIELLPEVVTLNPQGIDCVSWVAMSAQSRASLVIPPVRTPRNVTVTYWRGGLMVSSTQISHPRAMKEALEKLSGQLARQYRLDQPPALPDFSKPLQ